MRSFVVASLTVLMLVCATSASARGWRDLRIDASSDSRFTDSIQQMRNELPYNKALLFGLVLTNLETRLAPAEYRQRLDGLTYKQIAHLASPVVRAQYLAHRDYGGYGGGSGWGFSVPDGTAAAPGFSGGSWSGSTVGVGVTWGGQQ